MTEEQYREIMSAIADMKTTIDQVDLRSQAIAQALENVGISVPNDATEE